MAQVTDNKPNPLEEEIERARRQISSDSYPMSIGEITNLYRDGELIIQPAFQRLFRWEQEQKSRLVESLLLGIPIPSIFVAQGEDGKWELVDGLQRVSTILELQGVLKSDGEPLPPLQLSGTQHLPSLEGRYWDGPNETESLSAAQRIDIKRAKLDIKIIKRGSSPAAKYDLFQRLNAYGSPLTAQEVRSALLVSINPEFNTWLEKLAQNDQFVECTALSDRLISEKYDVELIIRFLVLHSRESVSSNALRSFAQFLDNEAVSLAMEFPKNKSKLEKVFNKTFEVLWKGGGENAFRKWDTQRKTFVGGFLNTAFEVIAMGLGYRVAGGLKYRDDIANAAKELWKRSDMGTRFATGLSTEVRLAKVLPIGRDLMAG